LRENVRRTGSAQYGLIKEIGCVHRRWKSEPVPNNTSIVCHFEENAPSKFERALAGHPTVMLIEESDSRVVARCHAIRGFSQDFPGAAAVLRPQ
jgi:hypothetical protein